MKCSLFSNDIQTIIPPPKHETAGKTGRLPGIFRHNERIVRVVDVRTKFGLSPSDPSQGRVIIAELDKGMYAFWVDKVINVIDQEDGRWDILPAALPREVFTSTFIMDKDLILHTECARLEAMVPSAGLRQHIEKLEAQIQNQVQTPRPVSPPLDIHKDAPKPQTKPTEQPATSAATVQPKPVPTTTSTSTTERTSPPGRATPPPPARPTTPTRPASNTARPAVTPPAAKRITPPAATVRPPVSPRPTTTSTTETTRTDYSRFDKPVPTPQAPAPDVTRTEKREPEEEEGSMLGIILLVLLLFGAASGAILYVSGAFDSSVRKPPTVSRYEPAPPVEPPVQEPVYTPPLPQPAEVVPVVEPEPSPPTETAEPEFSADIDRQDRVLTITLDGPEDESVRPLLKEDEVVEQTATSETETPKPAATEAIEVESEPAPEPKEKPQPPKPRLQVTHVVVKGDTLWDIAERYVKDPFRYPELARLSGIKNPDKIYPGDIVRIIEK